MEFIKNYSIKEAKKLIGKEAEIFGFVHEFRDKGKIKFIIIRDWSGTIQAISKAGDNCFEKITANKEDAIYAKGKIIESKVAKEGVELLIENFEILGKVSKKLPVDPTGVIESDIDTRLNYRFLDLRTEKIKNIFLTKATASSSFRENCTKLGFVEIHPTSIVATATEGGADVFPIEYFDKKAYLAQSPQLYKQIAVLGGLEKVFMQMHVFRAEKHNTTAHLNEIIQMDVECAFIDDKKAMDLLEEIFVKMIEDIEKIEATKKANPNFNAVKKVKKYTYSEIVKLLNENNEKIEWGQDFTKEQEKKMYEILNEETFIIYEWPTSVRAFYSMPKQSDPETCLAYDLMYKGLEIASGAQRIHIPELLEQQLEKRNLNPKHFEFYIDAFRYGAPPHAGWSIGLERFTMKALDLNNIREVMLFPRDRERLTP